jgi:hypothetical protein
MDKLTDLYKALGEQLAVVQAKANMTRYLVIGLDHEVLCKGGIGDLAAAQPLPDGWFYEQYPDQHGRVRVTKRQVFRDPVLVGYLYKV